MTRGGDDPYGFELRAASPTRPVRGRLSDGRLYVDLVPTSAWLSNLQAELTGLEWRSCSAFVAARAAHQCEVCGSRSGRLECHERWSFDEVTGIQRLTSLQALEKSAWARDALGQEFLGVYLAVKRAEYRQFMAEVGEQDWRWYLTEA